MPAMPSQRPGQGPPPMIDDLSGGYMGTPRGGFGGQRLVNNMETGSGFMGRSPFAPPGGSDYVDPYLKSPFRQPHVASEPPRYNTDLPKKLRDLTPTARPPQYGTPKPLAHSSQGGQPGGGGFLEGGRSPYQMDALPLQRRGLYGRSPQQQDLPPPQLRGGSMGDMRQGGRKNFGPQPAIGGSGSGTTARSPQKPLAQLPQAFRYGGAVRLGYNAGGYINPGNGRERYISGLGSLASTRY